MNQAYQKEYRTEELNEDGIDYLLIHTDEILNPITKDNPYLHKHKSVRGKSKRRYRSIHNHLTGEFMYKIKLYGNNRANTSKRPNVHSRHY